MATKRARDISCADITEADGWVTTRKFTPSEGDLEIQRRVIGKLELYVDYSFTTDEVWWHVFCEGNGILLGQIRSRERGPVAWLMNEARRAAEEAVGLHSPDRSGGAGIYHVTPARLHPDDIEAIADRVAAKLRAPE